MIQNKQDTYPTDVHVAVEQLWNFKKSTIKRIETLEGLVDSNISTSSIVDTIENTIYSDSDILSLLSAEPPIGYNPINGKISLNYNTTNLKLTSGNLNTIQDIHTGASPTFNNLYLDGNIQFSADSNHTIDIADGTTDGTNLIIEAANATSGDGGSLYLRAGTGSSNGDVLVDVGDMFDVTLSSIFRSKVGIGTTAHANTLIHVYKGSGGGATPVSNSAITFESSGDNIVQFLNPEGYYTRFYFGSSLLNSVGEVRFDSAVHNFEFYTSNISRFEIREEDLEVIVQSGFDFRVDDDIVLTYGNAHSIYIETNGSTNGDDLTIQAGNGYGGYSGGDLYLKSGSGTGETSDGDIYLDALHTDANGSVYIQSNGVDIIGPTTINDSVYIKSTTSGASIGPYLFIDRDNTTDQNDNFYGGMIKFRGTDDGDTTTDYASIGMQIVDVTNGSEDGSIFFQIAYNESLHTVLELHQANGTSFYNLNDNVTLQLSHDGSGNPTLILQQNDGTDLINIDGSTDGDFYFTPDGSGAVWVKTLDTGDNLGNFNVGNQTNDQLTIRKFNNAHTGTYYGVSKDNLSLIESGSNSKAFLLAQTGNYPLVFGTNSNERMRISGAGAVGIGTTGPECKLHLLIADASIAPYSHAHLTIEDSDYSYIQLLGGTTGGTGIYCGDSAGATKGGIVYDHSTESLHLLSNSLQRLHIDSSGKVSIGVSTASSPLHIKHDPSAGSPWIGQLYIEPSSNDKEGAISLKTTWTGTDRVWSIIAGSGIPNTNFRIYDSTAVADRVTIDSNGYVDILNRLSVGHTNTPSYPLDVQTDAGGGYAGYFFNDGNNVNRYPILLQGGVDTPTGSGQEIIWAVLRDGDGTNVGIIEYNGGNCQISNTSTADVKEDIVDTPSQIDKVNSIRVRDYKLKNGNNNITGFIAEECEAVYPAMVSEFEGTKMISQTALIPLLVKAIQELKSEIDLLKGV